MATVARIAEHAFHPAAAPIEDPIYAKPDFAADFFGSVRAGMEGLVTDPGYAALLGAYERGPVEKPLSSSLQSGIGLDSRGIGFQTAPVRRLALVPPGSICARS